MKLHLAELERTRIRHLTPRKQLFYKNIKHYEKVSPRLQKKCRSRKNLFALTNPTLLLTDPKFTLLNTLTSATKLFIQSQIKHSGTVTKSLRWTNAEKRCYWQFINQALKPIVFSRKVSNCHQSEHCTVRQLYINWSWLKRCHHLQLKPISNGMKCFERCCVCSIIFIFSPILTLCLGIRQIYPARRINMA